MGGFVVDVLRLALWLALLAAVFVPLERLFAVRRQPVWRAQTGVDLVWYFVNSLLPAAIIAVPLASLAQLLARWNGFGLYAAVAAWPLWAKLLGAAVVNDIGAYWVHRWQHSSPFLWRFHAVHHSAEAMDWLVNTRAHPIDMVVVRLGGLVPVYALGLARPSDGFDPVVAWVMITGTVLSFLVHANVRWRFGPLEQAIATPAFHHWHHTNDEHRDRNFAAVFPWIDRLFGTLWLPKTFPPVYGIDGQVAPTLAGQAIDPLLGPVRPRVQVAE